MELDPVKANNGPAASFTRRGLLRCLGGGGLVLLAGGAALLGGRREPEILTAARPLMGTRATILLAAPTAEGGRAALEQAFAALHEVQRLMSRYRAESDVGRINGAPGRWHTVHPLTAQVLQAGLEIARATDGYFDPCMERVVSRWGFHDRRYPRQLPPHRPPAAVAATRYRSLETRLDAGGARQFRLTGEWAGVDLGGIAKGFAVDEAVARLRSVGIRNALVNVGDDLYALGEHPGGGPWRIGVRHPRRTDALLEVLQVRERAVATSGDYENYFEAGGRRYAHLLDPHTGRPAGHHQSLTVTAETALLADAVATGAFVAPPHRSRALLSRLVRGPWLAVDGAGKRFDG